MPAAEDDHDEEATPIERRRREREEAWEGFWYGVSLGLLGDIVGAWWDR